MTWIVRGTEFFFALLFLFGALVQYNDPDPLRWMAIYLAASVSCFLAGFNNIGWQFPAAVAVIALVWALIWAPQAFPNVRFGEMFEAWEMKSVRVEEGREMYGLLIIFVVMTILAITRWFATRTSLAL
jgi:hypothetical protein